jgi:hypothetical protein
MRVMCENSHLRSIVSGQRVEQKDCIPAETATIHYIAEIGICRFGKPGILQVSPAASVYPHTGKAHGDGGSVRTHC